MGNGAAGTISLAVTMVNKRPRTCTMKGYPGMQLLDASGNSLPTNVVRGGGSDFSAPAANQPPSLVTLAAGQQASFSLSYEDVPVGNETLVPDVGQGRDHPAQRHRQRGGHPAISSVWGRDHARLADLRRLRPS